MLTLAAATAKYAIIGGADGGNRTRTPLKEADFKSAASTSSATSTKTNRHQTKV